MARFVQASMAGGEVSPAIAARVDFKRRGTAVAEAENFVVRPEGGMENRGGLKRIAEVKDSTKDVRLIPFEFNTTQTYILEVGDQYIRFFSNAIQILDSAAQETISGATQANPVVLTVTGHALTDGDEIYVSGVAGMTELNGRWFIVANAATNTVELTERGGANVDGTGYTAYSSGGTATPPYELATPYLEADLDALNFAQTADVLTIVHPSYAPRELSRIANDNWSLDEITYASDIVTPTSISVTADNTGTTTIRYKVTAVDRDTGAESLAAYDTGSDRNIDGLTQTNPVVLTDTLHSTSVASAA